MAKLPLDKYLHWGAGSGKSLTLNQMVSILNDVKLTEDWKYALRHVPKRKIMEHSSGENINGAVNGQRFSRYKTGKKWIPSANINFKLILKDEN